MIDREPTADDGPELTDRDWSAGVEIEDGRSLRAAISNAMVGLKKQYYGKGPTKARTFIEDVYVFCVLEDGLTRNERTLLEAGNEDVVRGYRLTFQAAVAATTTSAIERLTGCSVVAYHSQIVFDPDRAFEIFVLDRPPERAASGR